MQQQRAPKVKVQCQQCRRSFVQRPNGNPWSHKCVPVRQFQVPDNFLAPQVQQARQPGQVQQPVLNFQNFLSQQEVQQSLEQARQQARQPVLNFQNFRSQQELQQAVQQARQPAQALQQAQAQQPVLNFRAHFEVRFQEIEQHEEKKIEDREVIQESIMFELAEEQEKLKSYYNQQENLDEIRGELNDGLYLELCNGLLKEVRDVNKNIERYKQDLLRF